MTINEETLKNERKRKDGKKENISLVNQHDNYRRLNLITLLYVFLIKFKL